MTARAALAAGQHPSRQVLVRYATPSGQLVYRTTRLGNVDALAAHLRGLAHREIAWRYLRQHGGTWHQL